MSDRPLSPRAQPRRGLSFTTAITIALTAVLVTTAVLVLPSAPMESVRRTLRLGSERAAPGPPIEDRGGEVLKFMGDGILAIFRAGESGEVEACMRAFGAARAAQLRVGDRNKKRDGAPCFEVGIALHFGNAAYGNVGSGERLDYTVIGRDVNLASRIADLCGRLGECLILSEPFQSRLSEHELRSLGTFPLKGVDQPQAIFAPAES